MKKIFIVFFLGILSLSVYSQDLIVEKDGTVIQSKILKVSSVEVEYKKWSNQEGPIYSIAIADILAINYPDGSKEDFANVGTICQDDILPQSNGPQLVAVPTADYNDALITRFNQTYSFTKPFRNQGKLTKHAIAQFWFEKTSVISNNELEMSFVLSDEKSPQGRPLGSGHYCLMLKNKTNDLIYVDLANCFRVNEKENDTYCYYRSEQTSITEGGSTGASINLGGITSALGIGGVVGTVAGATTVGGSKGNSVQRVYSQQQIISIPPHGTRKISDFKYLRDNWEAIEEGEDFFYSKSVNVRVTLGEIKHFTLNNSPVVYDYTITYSTKSDFSLYSQLRSTMYLANLYGVDQYYWTPSTKDRNKLISLFNENLDQIIYGHVFY